MAQGREWTKEEKETIIQSLQPYLELGFSRNRACGMIGLAPATLSNWIKEDEALGMKIQSWENAMNRLALANIRDAMQREAELEEDIRKENSWKWAERKMKDEFSTRNEHTGADGKDLPTPLLYALHDNDSNQEGSETKQED